ncbi:MAG: TolC family protein [Rhodanobacteraceae bacterium]
MRLPHLRWLAAVLCLIGLSTGCATFHALPLDSRRAGPQRIDDIVVAASSMPVPELRAHRFDPSDGLDVTEVAMLAVANNPDLRVQRDDERIARAQAFAAGLLPDPQLSYEHDHPTSSQADLTSAFNLGLTYDLGNLLTRSARVASAQGNEREVHLKLLWSEWQTVAKARTLFDDILALHAIEERLRTEKAALAPLQQTIQRALAAGDLTYDAASAGLNAAADVDSSLADKRRQLDQARHDLHTLLGLDEHVALHLVGPPYMARSDAHDVSIALANMSLRRPDLRALQAGYESQQQKLRAAILAQFPAISVGFVRARDTGNVYTSGFSVALSLPLFDGNRGNIAIERATRVKLRDAYGARVLSDRNDIDRLLADLRSFRAQRDALMAHAAQLARARQGAQRSYAEGLLDWPTYLSIRASSLAADSALAALEQNYHTQAIALNALVGGDWPQPTDISTE